jgi:hypothetical protein
MKNINFEIKQLQKLNFISENEIKKIKFYINYTKEKINELKKIDFVIEDEKDIILSSKNEINIVETQLNMKLLELRKKLNILKSQEEDFKKKIEFANKKINEGKDILNNVNNNKKYINPSEIIDEDKNEDFTKSISNFTNSLSLNNTKHYYLNSLDSNEKYSVKSKMHTRNLIFLDSFILNKENDNKSENIVKKINIDNHHLNMNIDLNLNLKKINENNLINEESNKNENQYFLNILESEK